MANDSASMFYHEKQAANELSLIMDFPLITDDRRSSDVRVT